MLTVKHILNNDEEQLYQSPFVRFQPQRGRLGYGGTDEVSYTPATVWVEPVNPSDPTFPLTGGVAYVMNDHGATVGRYSLGDIDPAVGVPA